MPLKTELTERLGIEHPIIQAPMAGGGDTPELVASVCNAGALGFVGAAYLSPAQILEVGRAVREKTNRPFGMNLFAPLPEPEIPKDAEHALKRLVPFFLELGLAPPALPAKASHSFSEQLEAVLQTGTSCLSFTFAMLPSDAVAAIELKKLPFFGTATTVEEAIELERAGVDGVIAQGCEAGGHRGTFGRDFESAMVGTIALVPQIVDAVRVPVIASGGIMDGRGIAAALALGASAVQMGTAFLTCEESGVSDAYKEAILHAREDQTRVTRAFSGRPARGIINRFMTELESGDADAAILPFPLQNGVTRPLRSAAAKQGRAEFLSLWAGQGMRMARRQSAAELVARLVRETNATLERLQTLKTSKIQARPAI